MESVLLLVKVVYPSATTPVEISRPPAMGDVAQYAVRDGVAVITLTTPPSTAWATALRAGILENLKKQRPIRGQAAVIHRSAKAFSGGADIREFNTRRV